MVVLSNPHILPRYHIDQSRHHFELSFSLAQAISSESAWRFVVNRLTFQNISCYYLNFFILLSGKKINSCSFSTMLIDFSFFSLLRATPHASW